MMKSLVCSLVTAALVGVVASATTGRPCISSALNTIVEFGCWGYSECVNGHLNVVKCPAGQVFERDTMKCKPTNAAHTDCGRPDLCAGKPDAMYADVADHCETYVRCQGGSNIGRLYCPASLVFNEGLQVCDFKSNVVYPCGTLTPTTA